MYMLIYNIKMGLHKYKDKISESGENFRFIYAFVDITDLIRISYYICIILPCDVCIK